MIKNRTEASAAVVSEDSNLARDFRHLPPFLPKIPIRGWFGVDVYEPDMLRQMRITSGRHSWRRFRAQALAEHQLFFEKTDEIFAPENWAIIDQGRAPAGWSNFVVPDFYMSGDDAMVATELCLAVRDPAKNDGVVGFVLCAMSARASVDKPYSLYFSIDVELIYVLPSFRGQRFGMAMSHGLGGVLYQLMLEGLEHSHELPISVHQISLFADCDSQEGFAWMEAFEAEIRDLVEFEKECGEFPQSFASTDVDGDYGF